MAGDDGRQLFRMSLQKIGNCKFTSNDFSRLWAVFSASVHAMYLCRRNARGTGYVTVVILFQNESIIKNLQFMQMKDTVFNLHKT